MKNIPKPSHKISDSRMKYANEKGQAHEDLFKKICEDKGWEIVKTPVHIDKRHIDFYVNGKGVDVKTAKNLNSIWLEHTNVYGYPGWLFSEVEVLAFYIETKKSFYCFSRIDLLKYVKNNVSEETNSNLDYNKLYCRGDKYDAKDKIVEVKYTHIKHIKHKIL